MKRLFFSFLVLIVCLQVRAQTGKSIILRGSVTDVEGDPLVGATVSAEGTYKGVLTGYNGDYILPDLTAGKYILRFSFVGYEIVNKTVTLRADTIVDIILAPVAVLTNDVIINATRAGSSAPMAFTEVTNELLEKRNSAHDMPFLLSLTPSFIETSESGNGVGYTNMRIRGTDASRINVTIDGIPLNDPESQQVFWVDLPDLASSVDNIQVQRGVGTSSNGAGAFGASINIQTKGIEKNPFAEIISSAGSFGTFKNTISAGTGILKDKFAFQLRLSGLKSNGYIERTGSDHKSAFISGLYRSGRSLLKANIILGKEHTGIGWWGVPQEMLGINRRYNPAGKYTDENQDVKFYENESDNYIQNHYQLIYSLRLTSLLSFHTALHYTKGKGYYEEYREDDPYSDYGLPPVSIGDTTFYNTDLIRQKWMSNDFFGLVYSFSYKKNRIEASLGGGMNNYSGDHYGKIIWMKYPGGLEKDYEWYFNNGMKNEASIYGKLTAPLTGRISVFGDIQYRFIKYTLSGIYDDLRDLGQDHSFSFLNPKAGFFFKINDNQDAFISFSVANREPTRTDFTEASGDAAATPKPERLYDTEAGYKIINSGVSLSVNMYFMDYKDQLVPTGELNDVGYPIMTNVRKSYRYGTELSAGFMPARFISWDMNLTLSRNKIPDFTEYYTDYNSSDGSSHYLSRNLGKVDIAYSPSVIATSDFSVTVIPVLRIHLISKYVGKQYFDNTMNSERMLDPYFVNNIVIDAEPELKFVNGFNLQLMVNNILNSMYESNAYGGNWFEDGVEKTWAYYFPQAGVNFMVKIGLKF